MHRTPNRVHLFALLAALLVLAFSLAPTGTTLAAVNENFNGPSFGPGDPIDCPPPACLVAGVTSIISTPANSTIIADITSNATPPITGNSLLNQVSGTMTIQFSSLQNSYNFAFYISNLLGPTNNTFTVQGTRTGIAGPVFVNNISTTISPDQGIASGSGDVFDRLIISSTTAEWGLDNLVTTDAPPGVSIIGTPVVDEAGATTASYTIALDSATTGIVEIDIAPDAQCTVSTPTVTFASGSPPPQTVVVQAVDDDVVDPTANCLITHSFGAGTTDPVYSGLGAPSSLTVTVNDDDVASVNISKTAVSVTEAGGTEDYTVVLGSQPVNPVNIQISPDSQCTLNGNPSPTIATFNDTNWNIAQTITVGAVDDQVAEGTHTCTITHSITTVDSVYSTLPALSPAVDITGTITDNDVVGITVTAPVPASIGESGITTTLYTIALDTDPVPSGTNVHIALTPNSRCTVFPTSLDFTAGDTPQDVNVTAVNNLIVDTSPLDCVINHVVTSADATYNNFALADVTIPVTDDDVPGLTFTNGGSINVVEGDLVGDTYQISLDTQPTTNVTITITTPDGECTVSPAAPVITAPSTGPVTITVVAVDDSTVEALFVHPCQIDHTASGGEYAGLTGNLTANVTDNDVAAAPVYFSTPASGVALTTINTTTGVNGTASVQIQNTGTADLTISSFAMTTGTVMTATSPLGANFILTPNATTTITVTCNSATANTFTDTLTVNHDAVGTPATYPVTCNVAGVPVYTSTPASGGALTAINTTVSVDGTTSLQIQNTGTGDLTISSFALTTGAVMTASSPSGANFTLAPNATATINITCNSGTANTFNDTLTVNHDAVGTPATYTITCNVTGVPVYTSTPNSGVALTTINTTTGVDGTASLQIQNTGTGDLTISSFALTTGAVMTASSPSGANFTLAPNAFATITVTCNSAVANTFTDTLTVNHDAAGTPATYPVTCNVNTPGVPVYFSTPVSGNPLTTINTTTGVDGSATVQIQNTGTADLTVSSFAMTTGTVMSASSPLGANFTLAPNATTTITVTCNSATANTFTDTLTVNHDAAGTPATYSVTCNVTGVPVYTSTPASTVALTAINTTVSVNGTTSLQIQNTGTADLTISSFALTTGAVMTASSPSGANFILAPNATTTITVTCNSATANTFTDTLTVNHNAVGTPATYPVTCNVTGAAAPGYNSVPVPTTALTINTNPNVNRQATVVISENGTADLTITNYAVTGGPQLTVTGVAAPFNITDNSNGTQTLTVNCLSAALGTFTGTLTVDHNAVGTPATYPVTCNVTNVVAGPNYTSVPNPGQTLAISATVNNPADGFVRVTNTGSATLSIGSVLLTGTGIGQMSLSSPTSFTVLAGQSSDITIQCLAFAQGTFTATLTVSHNGAGAAPNPATYTVTCNVGAGAPGYNSVPAPFTTVDVGTVLIGTAISTNITVFETGTAQLNVSNIFISSGFTDFSLATTPFFSIVDGGVAQTITIRCVPSSAGLRTATLFATTNDPTRPTVTYNLICTGSTVPVVTATPPGFVPTAAPPTATVVVPATGQVKEVKGLAVRTGPYLGATLVSVARPGTTYSVLAQNNEEGSYIWYLIQVGNVTGWVSGRYLQVAGTLSAVPFGGSIFDQIDGSPDVGVRLTVNAIIDMRRRPSPRVARVATIPKDTVVVVLGRTVQEKQTFWIQVSYNGVVGWIPALPVEMSGPRELLPVR